MLKTSSGRYSKVIRKIWLLMVYLTIPLLMVPPTASTSGTPVVHENPNSLTPSRPMDIDLEMDSFLSDILANTNNISIHLVNQNFNDAQYAFNNLDLSYTDYKKLASEMNSSDLAFLVSNLNLTHDELQLFVNNSQDYNVSRQLYLKALADGDSVNASIQAEAMRDDYANLTSAYSVFRRNSTDYIQALDDRNIDTSSMQDTLNNFNQYMTQTSDDYRKLGIDANTSILELSSDKGNVPVGGSVTLTGTLEDKLGNPVSGSLVNVYVDDRLAGSFTTDSAGHGQASYTIPANVSGDHILADAEYIRPGGRTPRSFSNEVELLIPDIETRLTLDTEPGRASYGDTVTVRGWLQGIDGTPAPGKAVAIYLQDAAIGRAVTGEDGNYTYTLPIACDAPGGLDSVHAAYQRKGNDVFMDSTSGSKMLEVSSLDTALSINGSPPYYVADRAAFNGRLTAGQGAPADGANITIYIDGMAMWTVPTDTNGNYNAAFTIPYDMTAGSHGVYAAFDPGSGRALTGSRSEVLNVSFIDSGHRLVVQGLPLTAFKGDTLNLSGTFDTGKGMPVSGRALAVGMGGTALATVTSGSQGDFGATYTLNGSEAAGLAAITVSDINSSTVMQAGQVLVIPYDKSVALFAFVPIIIVVFAVIIILLRARRPRRQPLPEIGRAPGTPAPMPTPTSEPPFNISGTMESIRWTMDSGDLKRALFQVYQASKKIIGLNGVGVDDSMTHTEFYRMAVAAFPSVSMPLGHIIVLYEMASYAHLEMNSGDIAAALNSLEEIAEKLGGRAAVQ